MAAARGSSKKKNEPEKKSHAITEDYLDPRFQAFQDTLLEKIAVNFIPVSRDMWDSTYEGPGSSPLRWVKHQGHPKHLDSRPQFQLPFLGRGTRVHGVPPYLPLTY